MSIKNGSARLPISVDNIPHRIYGHYLPHKRITYDNEVIDPKTGELVKLPSMTKQEFVKQCDINNIIKEFSLTGQINHINAQAAQGRFLDLPDDLDFQSSLHTVKAAQDAFQALPAAIRNRFHGDPAEFMAFCGNPSNAAELIELGIRERPPRKDPAKAPTPEPASTPAPGGSQIAP